MTLRQGRLNFDHLDGYGIADIDQPQPRQALDLDAIARWNAANRKARDEYEQHPIAACDHDDCDSLSRGRWCSWHARLAAQKENLT